MNPRPTSIRSVIVFVTMLLAVLLYLERVCLNISDVFIREDLRLSKDKFADVTSVFFFAYALGQVPAGWLAQRYGPRLMLSLYMFGLVVFGTMIAMAQNYFMLFLGRFLLGLSQAGAYPAAAIVVKRWFPDRDRGFASGIVAFGGRFGGAMGNLLTGVLIVAFVPSGTPSRLDSSDILDANVLLKPNKKNEAKTKYLDSVRSSVREQLTDPNMPPEQIAEVLNQWMAVRSHQENLDWAKIPLATDGKAIRDKPIDQRTTVEVERLNRFVLEKAFPDGIKQVHGLGWRPTLISYAIAALVLTLVFWVIVRDFPNRHPWCNQAERELIEQGQFIGKESGRVGIPWASLLTSRNQWICSCFHLCNNIGWIFLITYMARYLDERFQVPVDIRGLMTTLPLFLASIGMLIGGRLTDRLTKRYGRRIGRVIPMALFKIPCVIGLALCPYLPTAWAVVISLSIMSMSTDIGIPSAWAFAQDTGGKHAATVLGWVNMWGNLGAALGAKFLSKIQEHYGWDAMLYTCATAFLFSGLFAAFTRADKPLEE